MPVSVQIRGQGSTQWLELALETAFNSGLNPASAKGGAYDEATGVISIGIHFDETDIWGPTDTLRNYLILGERRPG